MALTDFLNAFDKNYVSIYAIDTLNSFKIKFMFNDPIPTWATEFSNLIGSTASPSSLDLTLFVQSVSTPKLTAQSADSLNSLIGKHVLYNLFVQPTETSITMSIINTQVPIIETFLYPWLRELSSPEWKYSSCPFATANVEVDLTSHTLLKYKYFGVRPSSLGTYSPAHALPPKPVRNVTFDFDFMAVESKPISRINLIPEETLNNTKSNF